MRKVELKNDNAILIKEGEIETEIGDVLLIWTSIDMKNGGPSFYKIHRLGGSQLSSSALLLNQNVKYADAFSTNAGYLNFRLAIHCIIPDMLSNFNTAFFNIVQTLITYKKTNLCRNIYLDLPIDDVSIITSNMLLYTELLEEFTFVIITKEVGKIFEIIKTQIRGYKI